MYTGREDAAIENYRLNDEIRRLTLEVEHWKQLARQLDAIVAVAEAYRATIRRLEEDIVALSDGPTVDEWRMFVLNAYTRGQQGLPLESEW